MKHGIFLRAVGVSAILAALGCASQPAPEVQTEPSVLVRQVRDVNTANYTGGLTRADRALADSIAKSLIRRFYAVCDPPNAFSGELVSFGEKVAMKLPPLDGVNPDLAFLIHALDDPRQEVRDVAAYTIGLLGPGAKAAKPFLDAKFATRAKGGWFNSALYGVSCQPVGAPSYQQTIPDDARNMVDPDSGLPLSPAVIMARLYLDPDVEYPPGLMSGAYEDIDNGKVGSAAPLVRQILDVPNLSAQKRIEALSALTKASDSDLQPALPSLIHLADSDNEVLRYYVGNLLIRLHHGRAIPLIIERIRDESWDGDWGRDLCAFGDKAKAAEGKLLEVAQRTDWARVQHKAVKTLGCAGSEESVPVLLSMLDGNDWRLGEEAANTLAKIGIATPEIVAALSALSERHWSARVRKAAVEAAAKLTGTYKPPPPKGENEIQEVILGGPPGPIDHGFAWCDERGRYSIDGKSWFMVGWIEPKFEPVPVGFPRKNVFLQGIGTQTFLRVGDGWLIGSNGFESEGTLAHVSHSGLVTEMEGDTGVPFGQAAINGIVHTQGKYFAFGFELLKVGHAGVLLEISKEPEGKWSAKRVAVLPSAPWFHAIGPRGELLLGDGPNQYAVIDNRIVPLKCEKVRPGSYFDGHH